MLKRCVERVAPVGRGVICEVTPIGLLTRFLGSSFSHRAHRVHWAFLRTVSSSWGGGPSPNPSPVGRGVICEVTPIGLLTRFLGIFFSHRTHRFNRTCGALFRTHRTPPAYRIHRGLSAIIITNKGHNEAYILFIGVSRWLRPSLRGRGRGRGHHNEKSLHILKLNAL